jgi:hypothetical protein
LGLVIFILPLIAVNSILILSQSFEFKLNPLPGNYYKDIKLYDSGDALRDKQDIPRLGFAIPYIDGTTSISRLARVFPNWLIFKPVMIITGILLCFFWRNQKKIFVDLDVDQKLVNKFYYFGLISGITLIIHSIFLGIKYDNDLYKFLVRLNLACCVLFAITTKFYFVKCVKIISETYLELKNIFFKIQYYLAHILLIILFLSLFLILFENSKTFILIVEWNYFFSIFLFYLLYSLSWKKFTI